MKKTALILLLALSLLLSGCSLVVKDPAVDAKQVILDVNGQKVDKQAFTATYNTLLNQEYQLQQMYQAYGMQAPEINTRGCHQPRQRPERQADHPAAAGCQASNGQAQR